MTPPINCISPGTWYNARVRNHGVGFLALIWRVFLRQALFFHDLIFTTKSGSSTTFDKFQIERPIERKIFTATWVV